MNESLNLIEILKNVPKCTKLWSPAFGDVKFEGIDEKDGHYPISVTKEDGSIDQFTKDGRIYESYQGECLLFPSKEQRDWSQFKAPKQKVKYTLRPFDRVLVRDEEGEEWVCGVFSHYSTINKKYYCTGGSWEQCIPYNMQTAHLLDATDPCPIDYEFEFSKDYVPAPADLNQIERKGAL